MGDAGAPPFTGVVLCGGRSRRMGTDKALLEVGGIAMARRVAASLTAAGAREVFAQGGDGPALRALGLIQRPDSRPGDGPLAATIDALRDTSTEVALVVSCDLLTPDPDAMAHTVRALLGHPEADVAVPVVAGHHQWTHAAWRPRAAPSLGAAFDAGARSLRTAGERLRVAIVRELPLQATDDADTPTDLAPHRATAEGR